MENLEQMEEPLTQPAELAVQAEPAVPETEEEDRAPAEREISYWLVFAGGLLLYLLSVLPFLVRHQGVFFYYGDYNVQQVPFYIMAHRAVREGRFFWNSYIDLGSSMGGSLSFYLWGSPFFWLTIPFPESWIPAMLPFLMALKYGTAMVTSYSWIRTQTKTSGAAYLGALLYTFSGFQACNIVFQHFHDVTAFFPLFLLALDRMMEKGKWRGFAVMTALMSIINYYFFVGEVIFLILYYLVRRTGRLPLGAMVREIVRIILAGTAGIALAAFFLIQSLTGVIGNSRLSNMLTGYDILIYPDAGTPFAILKSLFMVPDLIARGTLFTNSNIANGSLAALLPCFALTGVIAYFLTHPMDWKKRLTLICALMAFIPVLNALFSALNSNYYARWFYMPLLIMACMTAEALEEGNQAALKKGALVSLGFVALFLVTACLPVEGSGGKLEFFKISENPRLLRVQIIGTLLMVPGLLWIVFGQPARKNGSRTGRKQILVTAFCCLICTVTVLYNGSSLIAWTGGVKWKKQMLGSVPEIPDPDTFMRVETDGTSTNYEMVWGIPTIHCFESTVSPSIFDFYRGIGMIRTVESTLPMERIGARALVSMRYYLENTLVKPSETFEEKGGLDGYVRVEDSNTLDDGYDIYENTHFIPMGFTFDYFMTEATYKAVPRGVIADRQLVRDLVLTEEQKEKYGHLMTEETEIPSGEMELSDFFAECDARAASSCSSYTVTKDGFRAETDMDRENLVFFSVPYDRGFTAYVDGQEREIERVDHGLMAVCVPEGSHTIEFVYFPAGLLPACGVSAAALLLLLASLIPERKRSGRNSKK